MKVLQRAVYALIVLLVAGPVGAQESFEGFVSIGETGRFPNGLYGATNLVPPNSLVLVQNLETGVTERVIVTEGVEQPGVFLVLAPAAAQLLGIQRSGTVRARVREIATSDIRRAGDRLEQALSQDPDINPAAGVGSLLDSLPPPVGADQPEEPGPEIEPEPEPEAVAETEPEPEASIPAVTEAPEDPEPQITVESEPEVTADAESAPGSRGIAEGIARTGEGQAQQEFVRPDRSLSLRTAPLVAEEFETAEPSAQDAIGELEATTRLSPPSAPAPTRLVEPQQRESVVQASDAGIEPTPEPEPEVALQPGVIERAVAALSDRLPAKDRFPRLSREEDDASIARVDTPRDTLVAALAEAASPPRNVAAADEPALAGLAPLAPPVEQPFDPVLAEARPVDTERPDGTLATARPEVVDPAAELAEAEPVGKELPEPPLAGAQPESVEPEGELAEALPVGEELPEPPLVDAEPQPVEPEADLAEARPLEDERPEPSLEPSLEPPIETAEPQEEPALPPQDAVLALEPADFRPPQAVEPEPEPAPEREPEPVAEPEPEPEPVEPEPGPELAAEPEPEPVAPAPEPVVTATATLPIVEGLENNQFYLQIGAYRDPASAEVAVNALAPSYPISVLPLERERATLYRVMVGPLNRDETGTLLLFLRARGYADAFLRSGNEL